ncbi:MAG TPA: hypothetical protein VIG74_01490 [Alphaproteobacteria bacterium]
MNNELSELFLKLVQERAKRYGKNVEDVLDDIVNPDEPGFMKAARRQGEKEGITAEEVLAQDLERFRKGTPSRDTPPELK